jgi:hypothetical protein
LKNTKINPTLSFVDPTKHCWSPLLIVMPPKGWLHGWSPNCTPGT